MLNLLAAAQAAFLAVALLILRHGNRVANRFLAVFLAAFAVQLFDEFMGVARFYDQVPDLVALKWTTTLLYGPCLYLYCRAMTSTEPFRIGRMTWLHFLLPATRPPLAVPFFALPEDRKLAFIYGQFEPAGANEELLAWIAGTGTWVNVVQIGVYVVWSYVVLTRHRREIRDQFSYLERVNLRWLRFLVISYGLIFLSGVFLFLGADALNIVQEVSIGTYLLFIVVVYAIGFMGLRQPEIFTRLIPAADATSNNIASRKYRKSALSTEARQNVLTRLQAYMRKERPYLDNELTLPQLAQGIDVPSHQLSQSINEGLGKSFFDFVNEYRVDEAKQALQRPVARRPNILTIAHDAGFNSKSAFYRAFRKHGGITPSEFRRAVDSANSDE